MTPISDAALEAAARAGYDRMSINSTNGGDPKRSYDRTSWDRAPEFVKNLWRAIASDVLEAIAQSVVIATIPKPSDGSKPIEEK